MTQQASASQRSARSPEYDRLDVFIGEWLLEGRQLDGPFGPPAQVSARQSFEWLPGGLFLIMRFDGRVGQTPAACIEVTGHHAVTGTYPTHTFYNDGKATEWQLREHKGTWLRSGAWQQSGKTTRVRCTTMFSDDGKVMASRWEHSINGSAWQTFWDVKATRVT